jgi:hypothetical protein
MSVLPPAADMSVNGRFAPGAVVPTTSTTFNHATSLTCPPTRLGTLKTLNSIRFQDDTGDHWPASEPGDSRLRPSAHRQTLAIHKYAGAAAGCIKPQGVRLLRPSRVP